jgi:hypothetical protein
MVDHDEEIRAAVASFLQDGWQLVLRQQGNIAAAGLVHGWLMAVMSG